jgi:hypothetical protein
MAIMTHGRVAAAGAVDVGMIGVEGAGHGRRLSLRSRSCSGAPPGRLPCAQSRPSPSDDADR